MAETKLSTPAAIVLAGVLIGGGLFFGLRDRSPATEAIHPIPAPSQAPPGPPASAAPAPAPSSPPPPPPVRATREAVAEQAKAAIDKERAGLTAKCWKPYAATTPPPKPAQLVFEFAFDPSGRQVARGVREMRGAGSPEITRCVLESLPILTVPPPGAQIAVEVSLTLP